ncbi:sigma-54 interaction domain-containing protein [Scopulibacillus cellulosilyticus]|uniref:HTH-type transcriptional regulatory protein TyrR n=1 Tax=Scopulibacillus cellulosilyticus TaxID=2665665 RepID=A0ABW2PVC8_9BACL
MAFDVEWDWEEIINSIYTDVIITNPEGIVVYANDSTEYWFGKKKEELIGSSVLELEKQNIFYPSITRKVALTRTKQTIIQETNIGRKLLVTGNMIFDKNGRPKYIISYSQDITELEELKAYLKKVEGELRQAKKKLRELENDKENEPKIIARSEKMKHVISTLNRVAETEATVLLTGESGVGKSLLAEHLHEMSGRKGKLVKINCGSIPESLLESELFGYKSGAFTGANPKGKRGLVEEAEGGTLFLDEIGELPYNLQVKMLTLIQEKKFYSIGDTKPKNVNFRLIAATNVDIEKMIQQGTFREDLYFRLSVIHITIPPLREREEDLLALIMNFLKTFNHRYEQNKELAQDTIDYLLNYSWPGNTRELSNIIERLVLTADGQVITPEQLPSKIKASEQAASFNEIERKTLPEMMRDTEVNILSKAWRRCNSTTEMAKYLGVSQPTIVRKLKKYKTSIQK